MHLYYKKSGNETYSENNLFVRRVFRCIHTFRTTVGCAQQVMVFPRHVPVTSNTPNPVNKQVLIQTHMIHQLSGLQRKPVNELTTNWPQCHLLKEITTFDNKFGYIA